MLYTWHNKRRCALQSIICELNDRVQEMEQLRKEEMEAMRIEEITSGGFIPPAEDIEAAGFDIDPESIPLPGEQFGGRVPTFDEFGAIRMPHRPFKKKVNTFSWRFQNYKILITGVATMSLLRQALSKRGVVKEACAQEASRVRQFCAVQCVLQVPHVERRASNARVRNAVRASESRLDKSNSALGIYASSVCRYAICAVSTA